MGLRTPLPDTPSLPIGADEVTVLDHTVAYATFPNLGKAVTPHAILEVRTGNGDVVWRFDRDGPKPRQVLPDKVALDMVFMMNKVAEEGTGRRAHARRRTDRRQDRHHQRLSRRLVRRLHRQLGRRRLGRQRRLQLDQPHDRRLAAGDDLARDHGLCPPGHRAQTAAGHCRRLRRPRRAPQVAATEKGRRRRRCGRPC